LRVIETSVLFKLKLKTSGSEGLGAGGWVRYRAGSGRANHLGDCWKQQGELGRL
jgi:hypothetical protein